MRRSKYGEEEIIGILKEHEAGLSAAEICRNYGISDATFYKQESEVPAEWASRTLGS